MTMKKITIAFLFLAIIMGCANQSTLNEKEICFKYVEELKDSFNMTYGDKGLLRESELLEVFYSKKSDSCLYATKNSTNKTNSPGENGTITDYRLFDVFSKEELIESKGCDGELHCGASTVEAEKYFYSELKKYK